MKNQQKTNKKKLFFLILFLFSTSLLSLKTIKKLTSQDIKIHGSKLFSKEDIVQNSSLNLPTRLIFIKTKYIEQELKKNLSLKNVSVSRQILPFGLSVLIKTRTPIAYGEKFLNGQKISGFVDEEGFFINKEYADKRNLKRPITKVFGWQKKYRKTLSIILTFQKNDKPEFIKIIFSKNGFLTLEEKDLQTILLGFNRNLIRSQLQIISELKHKLKGKNISKKIANIDLTDPNNPKIKVFKP